VKPPVILWYQQDLRIHDHPALTAAAASGQPLLPLYILDSDTPGRWKPGGASRWWLHHSLQSLQKALEGLGGRLLLRRGPADEVLRQVTAECGASQVFFTRRYEPHAAALERRLASDFEASGIALRRFGGSLLFEPEALANNAGQPYKVFTPFYKAFLAKHPLFGPAESSGPLEAPASLPPGDELEDWDLLPSAPDWAGGLRETWTPGEAGAEARLDRFLEEAMADYGTQRDRPDKAGTSMLSPHLHFGEISPRRCWEKARLQAEWDTRRSEGGCHAFLRELVWRDFSHHLLYHWPSLPEEPFRENFKAFPWKENAAHLRAWQRGETGYPMVDAGMRQLWHSGWMHNRLRMIAASFLVKHLLVPWQKGAAWFWDTLVDANLANNSASWQWVAGCGADAAPYFRIFNPMSQGEKFDPDGTYLRQWLPELAKLPAKHLSQPWATPADSLARAGIVLGKTYPKPLVDHAAARQRALAAFAQIKS
jgi:deoxyribodipyrimidine photo-lyase